MNLNPIYIKEWRFSKTQVVVFDLLQQEGIVDDYSHVIWTDNLFTSTDEMIQCEEIDFGVADTVRTTKTKREEIEEKDDTVAQKKRKEKNRDLHSSLSELKRKYEVQIEWDIMYEAVTNQANVLQFA